ncbi:MAG: SMC family ATPase, partial [Dehalococcoidia bacterium]
MIPSRLKMHNFMPYRGDLKAFSFEGIHTACICGDNGNGKSALIDAITWALWGKSRAKSDDDLIHLGEKHMGVEFDFFAAEQLYRVIRKHSMPKSRKASGQSSLDLFIANNGNFNVISGDTKSKTQQKLISLLNMDYDTFINSAFLRQGHTDEFSKQQPGKRKEVLAAILGLSLYDHLEERSRELARLQNMEKAQLANTILEIEQELVYKKELEISLNKAQNELSLLEVEINNQQTSLNRLRQTRDSLIVKGQQLARLEEDMVKVKEDLKKWHNRIEQRQKNSKKYQELIAKRQFIEEGYTQYLKFKKLNDEMNEKLRLSSKMKDKKSNLERSIQKAQAELLSQLAVSQSKIGHLEADLNKLSLLKEERATLECAQKRLSQMQEELQNKILYFKKLQTNVHELDCNQQSLEYEIRELEEKFALFDTKGIASCPLCETELGEEGVHIVKSKYKRDKEEKEAILNSQKNNLAIRNVELKETETQIKNLESSLSQDRTKIQFKENVIASSIRDSEEVTKELNKEKGILTDIKNKLIIKDFATEEQNTMIVLDRELNNI